jgi:hypothetical protein
LQQAHPAPILPSRDELPPGWDNSQLIQWVRFENVFRGRFETRNPVDAGHSPTFTHIEESHHDASLSAHPPPT